MPMFIAEGAFATLPWMPPWMPEPVSVPLNMVGALNDVLSHPAEALQLEAAMRAGVPINVAVGGVIGSRCTPEQHRRWAVPSNN